MNFIRTRLYLPLGLGICLGLLPGCRLGNRVEIVEDPDKTSGYYLLQPEKLRFCSTVDNTDCKESPISSVPRFVGQVLTDPVALIMTDLASGAAALTSPTGDGRTSLPIQVLKDNSLYLSSMTRPEILWRDEKCTSRLYVEMTGKITAETSALVTLSTGKKVQPKGRILLKLTLVEAFEGDCESTLQELRNCYLDVNQCGEGSSSANQTAQNSVKALFNPYIEAKVLTDSEIPTLSNLAYEVSYE
jgi:hypothetical protein